MTDEKFSTNRVEHCHFVYLNDFLFTWIQYQHLNIVVSII